MSNERKKNQQLFRILSNYKISCGCFSYLHQQNWCLTSNINNQFVLGFIRILTVNWRGFFPQFSQRNISKDQHFFFYSGGKVFLKQAFHFYWFPRVGLESLLKSVFVGEDSFLFQFQSCFALESSASFLCGQGHLNSLSACFFLLLLYLGWLSLSFLGTPNLMAIKNYQQCLGIWVFQPQQRNKEFGF